MAPVKSVRVIRDKNTHISKKYGFVEFYSVESCKSIFDYLKQNNAISNTNQLLFGNSMIHISFAKQTSQHLPTTEKETDDEALQIAQWNSTFEGNLSGYQFDSQSGYYYNSNLNYYYDSKSGYFYDCSRQTWMYFDSNTNQYIPIDANQTNQIDAKQSTSGKEDKVIGKSFVPNPVYQQAIRAVEEHEKFIQQKLLQQSSTSFKDKKRKRNNEKASTHSTSSVQDSTASVTTYNEEESNPLDDDNIGNKLLKKMGFQSGTGLGKNASGITAPIQAIQKENKAGLGYSYFEEPKNKKNKLS